MDENGPFNVSAEVNAAALGFYPVARDFGCMRNEEDIAAMTLWVEQHRGHEAGRYVADQISRSAKRGDQDSTELWQSIETRRMAQGARLIVPEPYADGCKLD